MTSKLKIIVILCVVTLSGCATNTNIQPPLMAHDEPAIIIRRGNDFNGGGCRFWVKLDNVLVGELGRAEALALPVTPGLHTIALGGSTWTCRTDVPFVQRDIEVLNKPVRLRYELDGVGKTFIPIAGLFLTPTHTIIPDLDR